MENYLDKDVGLYKKSKKGGYYFTGSTTLREALTDPPPKEIEKVKQFRETGDKEIKTSIMAYTPAGDYGKDQSRSASNELVSDTGQVQLDFDGKIDFKKYFKKFKWISAAGKSCSGKGAFILVNTPGGNYEEHFYALAEEFEAMGETVDLAVSSVNELRFLSLPEETLIREDASEYTKRKKKPVSKLDNLIPGDGELIEIADDIKGTLHYNDLVIWVGKNNSNGTPRETVLEYVSGSGELMEDSSSLYGDLDAVIKVVNRVYDQYQDQHGEGFATGGKITVGKNKSLASESQFPKMSFDKKDPLETHMVAIVNQVMNTCMIAVEDMTRTIYKYNGKFWDKVSEPDIDKFLVQSAIDCGYNMVRAQTTTFRKGIRENLGFQAGVNPINFDRYSLNLGNGILNFNPDGSHTFVDHDPDRNYTYIGQFDYDESAKCHRFDLFLDRVLPNEEDQEYLLAYIKSAFTKVKPEQMLFLIGGGANGKSTFLDVVSYMFGQACKPTNLWDLTNKNERLRQTAAYRIKGSLIAVSHDDQGIGDYEIFKKLSSRQPVTMAKYYTDPFDSDDYGIVLVAMNQPPVIQATAGAKRRFKGMHFGVQISDAEMDLELKDKLFAEAPGILNRILRAGSTKAVPKSVLEFTQRMIDESDHVKMFLVENGYRTTEGKRYLEAKKSADDKRNGVALITKTVKELYAAYEMFCDVNGIRSVMQLKTFSKRVLEEHRFVKDKYKINKSVEEKVLLFKNVSID